MLKLAFLMCLAALVAFAIPVEPEADAGLMPLHRHGPATHRHNTAEDRMTKLLIDQFGHDPRLAHDDPNRPDESHDYNPQPGDGQTTIRFPDGSAEVMHVMGATATYDGRFVVWDEHGGGGWIDPEDPAWRLMTQDAYPPEQPQGWACENDWNNGGIQRGGPGHY